MLTNERKSLLLQKLKKDGRLVAKDMARLLKLSEDSIRRDLRELAAEGLLTRVHGGALPASPTVANLQSRRSMSVEEKVALARAGVRLIKSGQSVFIDGGTTHVELVRQFCHDLRCQVFTHSPVIAAALEHHPGIDVVMLGGVLFRHSMVAVGAGVIQAIADLRVDVCFLGATGIHVSEGLSTGDYEEAKVKRAFAARAGEVVCLATREKLGAVSAHRIGPLSMLSALVVGLKAQTGGLSREVRIIRG
jgi:DeoR/GlpR family transcriptional regulator of sugar metabolism